jgi:predicted nucleic acid-binding protein
MNVYVESNFVLELALLQEEHESCERILSICENGKVQLILPAYSIAEPYETLARRDKSRNQLAQNVRVELRQLGRSKPYKTETDAFQAVVSLLVRSGEEEKQRLFQTRDRLLKVAEVIPLAKDILASAAFLQTKHGISPQDAIVYASMVQHLDLTGPAKCCFLNNDRDFSDPDIEDTLTKRGCRMLFSFSNGYNYIQSQI